MVRSDWGETGRVLGEHEAMLVEKGETEQCGGKFDGEYGMGGR